MTHSYAGLATLKTFVGITDTTDDAVLLDALEHISEEIDAYCQRQFQPFTATHYYSARHGDRLLLPDDLLSVTTLKTLTTVSSTGTRTYGDSWDSGDYDLYPSNAGSAGRQEPYWELRKNPEGSFDFPSDPRGVELAGTWGYWQELETLAGKVSGALSATATTISVTSATGIEVGQTLLIDSEQVYITALSGTTLTVERGVNGTAAVAHSDQATIKAYRYPWRVVRACLVQAQLAFRQKDAPFATFGGGEWTQDVRLLLVAGLHPFVRSMLDRLRRREAA